MNRRNEEDHLLANLLTLVVAAFNLLTGIFFITTDPSMDSPTYGKMRELMPLSYYGVIILLSAVLLIFCVFVSGRARSWSMLLGGLGGSISIGLYASASSIGGVNIMLPGRYTLISIACLIIAIVGGMRIWRNGRERPM